MAAGNRGGMLRAESFHQDGERLFIEPLRLIMLTHFAVKRRKIICRHRHFNILAAEYSFFDLCVSLVELFSYEELAAGMMNCGEVVEVDGDFVMLGPIDLREDR